MFLLVGFRPRHVLPTANRLQIGEPGGFCRQIGGTVPAVSPEDTSAHPLTALRRWHCTFLTHVTVHVTRPVSRAPCLRVSLSHRPRGRDFARRSANVTSCASPRTARYFIPRHHYPTSEESRNEVPFVSRRRGTSVGPSIN